MEYLIPGEMPAAVREHFQEWGVRSQNRTVYVPTEIIGYTVPDDEYQNEIHCNQFQEAAGLTEAFIAQNSHRTDVEGLTLIWNGTTNRTYKVLYGEDDDEAGSPRVRRLLERLAREFKKDIFVVGSEGSCFSGGRDDYCQPHTPEDYDGLLDPICLHFNCARRGNRRNRENLTQLYNFPLATDRGLAPQVRANPLRPAGGAIINDTNGQAVAEVDEDVIYILVNIDVSEEQYINRNYVWSYWGHDAEVLEKILRDAFPIVIAQGKKIREDPVGRQREVLAGQREQAVNQFLAHLTPPNQNRVRKTEAQIEENENKARQSLEKYLAAQRELERLQIELSLLQKNPHTENEGARQEVENVLQMPHVIGIGFGRTLEVYTNTIYIEWGGQLYRIGAFKLEIDFNRGVRIFNYTNSFRGYQHPHVLNREGEPCFGNISNIVAQMLRERQLEMLVTVLIEYLQSYNPEYPRGRIEGWPIVQREEVGAA